MDDNNNPIAARAEAADLYLPSNTDALTEYLRRSGRPVACRLDFKLTSLEELKKAAMVLGSLHKRLSHLAWESESDEMLRVLVARGDIESCRLDLKHWNASRASKRAERPVAAQKTRRKTPD